MLASTLHLSTGWAHSDVCYLHWRHAPSPVLLAALLDSLQARSQGGRPGSSSRDNHGPAPMELGAMEKDKKQHHGKQHREQRKWWIGVGRACQSLPELPFALYTYGAVHASVLGPHPGQCSLLLLPWCTWSSDLTMKTCLTARPPPCPAPTDSEVQPA